MKTTLKLQMVFHDRVTNRYYLCIQTGKVNDWQYASISNKIAKAMIDAGCPLGN
jgi:hypothetical protein